MQHPRLNETLTDQNYAGCYTTSVCIPSHSYTWRCVWHGDARTSLLLCGQVAQQRPVCAQRLGQAPTHQVQQHQIAPRRPALLQALPQPLHQHLRASMLLASALVLGFLWHA